MGLMASQKPYPQGTNIIAKLVSLGRGTGYDGVGTSRSVAVARVVERHELLGGEIEVVRFAHRPTYYTRTYVPGERRYASKSCRTTDLEIAK